MKPNLSVIQKDYVKLVLNHFVDERRQFEETGSIDTPANLYIPGRGGVRDLLESKVWNYINDLKSFWADNWPALQRERDNSDELSVAIWGDMEVDELLTKHALFFDSIAIPDPIYFIPEDSLSRRQLLKGYFKEFVRWTSFIAVIEPALLSDTDNPIAFVFPQQFSLRDPERDSIIKLHNYSVELAVNLLNEIFATRSIHSSIDGFMEEMRVRNMSEVNSDMDSDRLDYLLKPLIENSDRMPSSKAKGIDFDLLKRIKARRLLTGDVRQIFEACGSMFYVLETRTRSALMVRADNSLSTTMRPFLTTQYHLQERQILKSAGLNEEEAVSYSFVHGFKWLNSISMKDIVRIRESGGFEEIREIFRIGRRKLRNATIDDYPSIARELEQQVCNTLKEEAQSNQAILEKARKQARNSAISFGASVALGIASLSFPAVLPLSIGAAAYGAILGGSSLKDVVNEHISGKRVRKELGERPITFLLEANQNRGGKINL